MDFPLSRDRAARLIALAAVATTNDELVSLAVAEELPEFTVVVTLNQTAGKGRLGRTWDAPPGTSLAASVLLHPQHHHLPKDRYGWIPLVSGFAMSSALSRFVPKHSVSLKWPNDVLIDGRKVSGVLSELLPDAASVVVGAGVNLTIPAESLPVPTATSLLLHGAVLPAEELADLVLAGYLDDLRHIWSTLTSAVSETDLDGIRSTVSAACSTLGQPVRVSLPDGGELIGTAVDLDSAGRLRIRRETDGQLQTVAAGDVTHLRYE